MHTYTNDLLNIGRHVKYHLSQTCTYKIDKVQHSPFLAGIIMMYPQLNEFILEFIYSRQQSDT